MSKKAVEDLLIKGGKDREFRKPYDAVVSKADFIAQAAKDGFDFTEAELMAVINESGDSFESFGNPPKRTCWW